MFVLTVKQVIEKLQAYDPNIPVFFSNTDGTEVFGVYEIELERDDNGHFAVLFTEEVSE